MCIGTYRPRVRGTRGGRPKFFSRYGSASVCECGRPTLRADTVPRTARAFVAALSLSHSLSLARARPPEKTTRPLPVRFVEKHIVFIIIYYSFKGVFFFFPCTHCAFPAAPSFRFFLSLSSPTAEKNRLRPGREGVWCARVTARAFATGVAAGHRENARPPRGLCAPLASENRRRRRRYRVYQ